MTYAPPAPSLARRLWRGFWLVLAILVLLLHIVGGWVFSSRLLDEAFVVMPSEPARDVVVESVTAGSITLRSTDANPDVERNQVMGFEHAGGYLRLGPVESVSGEGAVTRPFELVSGAVPSVGSQGDVQSTAYPADPAASGLPIQIVTYETDLGPMDAWQVEGSRAEWVIHVHGEGAGPEEALRTMVPLARAGYHQLAITYRNDPGQPQDPSGMYQYGREEWADVAAAIDYAKASGAADIIVMGYSTGGAIAMAYVYRGLHDVTAMILDAPNLDMSATVDLNAKNESIAFGIAPPVTLTATAKVVAALRASINWSALDYAKRIGQLTTPTLIFHGTEDDSVPIETSREVAAARPRFVTLDEVSGAGHVESWNADPALYEKRMLDFIITSLG